MPFETIIMIARFISPFIDRTFMFDLCSTVTANDLIDFSGVDGPMGLQSGIIVNDRDRRTILVQTVSSDRDNPYPNEWDDEIPGIIHYCATRKGIASSASGISLESRLNRHVNLNIYPIFLFVRYPDRTFRFMGEFVRLPKYDRGYFVNEGKEGYMFALISKNIDSIERFIDEIKRMSG